MSAGQKPVVGVVFGGRSVEHDVSIVTGHQVMQALGYGRGTYDITPIYIDRNGGWFTGAPLMDLKNYNGNVTDLVGVQEVVFSPSTKRPGLITNPGSGFLSKSRTIPLDFVFPTIHGSHGEDGTLQGLLELADIPYVGCGVMASAIANDKIMTKMLMRQVNIPVIDAVSFTRDEWQTHPDKVLEQATVHLSYPLFIKPATLGSSIGIGRADDEKTLRASIDVAMNFDHRVLIEKAATDAIEINCAVIGHGYDVRPSDLEKPISFEEFLTFEEKYMQDSGGMKSAQREIPAPISDDLTEKIKVTAVNAFQAIEGSGTARFDFLVREASGEFYLNEINTMPGSLGFYLWEAQGLTARQLSEELLDIAGRRAEQKRTNTYNYRTSLVDLTAQRGLKGAKGSKR